VDESSASLTIAKIEETDTGVLTLRLKNVHGEVTADMDVIVISQYNIRPVPPPDGKPNASKTGCNC